MKEFIKIHQNDNVAVALTPLSANRTLDVDGTEVTLREDIPQGHKFALTLLMLRLSSMAVQSVLQRRTSAAEAGFTHIIFGLDLEICLLTPMIVLLQNLPRQLLALSEDTADRTEKSASVMKSGLFRL